MRFLTDPTIYKAAIQPATVDTPLADHIASNRKYMPYCADCLGAVDGTHIPISPPNNVNKPTWRIRKGFTSQNVLAVCDFEMRFTNVLYV